MQLLLLAAGDERFGRQKVERHRAVPRVTISNGKFPLELCEC